MRRLLMIVVTAAVGLAGCSADRSADAADAWAAAICGALEPWRAAITDLNQRAAEQMTQTTTTEQTRQNLVALVHDARDATEAARVAVLAAGVPAVDDGADLANGFTDSLAQTRDAYAAAEAELRSLPGQDESAFYDGVVEVLDRLSRRYEQAGVDLAELESPELRAAFARVPECQ
jgi:hypothetical protein